MDSRHGDDHVDRRLLPVVGDSGCHQRAHLSNLRVDVSDQRGVRLFRGVPQRHAALDHTCQQSRSGVGSRFRAGESRRRIAHAACVDCFRPARGDALGVVTRRAAVWD